ncbi:peptidase family U32 [Anopheles sinensis]|uniref:Peptidase family U32 n=1 Tax=Anopheles sinensis TaxID=74873 RepID=A0A084VQI1_ANOSI|nr:peptidase family U32 [Anopheles sinensis]
MHSKMKVWTKTGTLLLLGARRIPRKPVFQRSTKVLVYVCVLVCGPNMIAKGDLPFCDYQRLLLFCVGAGLRQ